MSGKMQVSPHHFIMRTLASDIDTGRGSFVEEVVTVPFVLAFFANLFVRDTALVTNGTKL